MKKCSSLSMFTSLYPKIDNEIEGLTLLGQLKHKFSNETHIIKLYDNHNKPVIRHKRKEISSGLKPKVIYNSPEKPNKNTITKLTKSDKQKPLFKPISNQLFLTQIINRKKHLSLNIELIQNKNQSLPVQKQASLPNSTIKKNLSSQRFSVISPLSIRHQKSRNIFVNVYPTKDLDTILRELYSKSNLKFFRKHHRPPYKDRYAFVKSKFNQSESINNRGNARESNISSASSRLRNKTFNRSPVIRLQRSVENLQHVLLKDLDGKKKEKEEIEKEYISIQNNCSDMKKVLNDDMKKMREREHGHSILAQNLRFSIIKEKIALISKLNSNMVYQLRSSLYKRLGLEDLENNKNMIANSKSNGNGNLNRNVKRFTNNK